MYTYTKCISPGPGNTGGGSGIIISQWALSFINTENRCSLRPNNLLSKLSLSFQIPNENSINLPFRWQISTIHQDSCDFVHNVYLIKFTIKKTQAKFY